MSASVQSPPAIYRHHMMMVDALQNPPPPSIGIAATENIKPIDHVTRAYWLLGFPVSAKPKKAKA